jgi:hypothetical protein
LAQDPDQAALTSREGLKEYNAQLNGCFRIFIEDAINEALKQSHELLNHTDDAIATDVHITMVNVRMTAC